MPSLSVRIKKKRDGGAALTCERDDGTVTWQRQDGQQGRFFPLHDLTHFAVESVLGFREAFFGLIAAGRDIEETAVSTVPVEALLAEVIVGFLDLELRTRTPADAGDFAWKIECYFADRQMPVPDFRITDAQLAAIRAKRAELFAQWRAVLPGEALELRFQ